MAKKGEYIRFKNYERKINSPLMIYADFEGILVPEDNGKQNPEKSHMRKYEEHLACSYCYKLVCVDDKFSKSVKSYLGEDAVHNFIDCMIKESRFCIDIMKKHFIVHNAVSLSRHEQVCFMSLCFERYFSRHWAT